VAEPETPRGGAPSPERRGLGSTSAFLVVLLAVFLVAQLFLARAARGREIAWSELERMVAAGEIVEVELRDDMVVAKHRTAPVTPGASAPSSGGAPSTPNAQDAASEQVEAQRLPGVEPTKLLDELRAHGVIVRGRPASEPWWKGALLWLLPLGLLLLAMTAMRRGVQTTLPLSPVAKSKPRLYDPRLGSRGAAPKVTFADVAGVDEAKAELVEVVDFLKHPDKYRALGARIPKGALLLGPPGTGKTLLARAVAGEADVPFFTLSGSEFVEMFVGVGAARMRDLFDQAKEHAPCIVFIDEIDAVGRSRGGAQSMAAHDEREQTLDQLLVEMNGFDATKGIVIIGATNRPEILDRALLRAGRFDRRILVDRPDVRGREAILQVHVRKVPLAPSVDLRTLAQRTPGMVGADLANVVNEAALGAARRGGKVVGPRDFEEAIDRIQLGAKKHGRVITEPEKRRVAFHEAGHAVVARSVEHADPVHRVTIIPRSIGALGATLQLPTDDRYLLTREELRDRLCVLMGGRAAEALCCGDVSTGAQNDLEQATEIAEQMVRRFGMSDRLGPRALASHGEGVLGALEDGYAFSDETKRAIDDEVAAILTGAEARARDIVARRRGLVARLAECLLTEETIERDTFEAMVAGESGAKKAAE
jgi:cell division protease FtsH